MVERFEKFLSSRKSRYVLGVIGVGVAMGLGVLGAQASSSSGQLSLPQTYNVSKEKVGVEDVTLGIKFFSKTATERANYTAGMGESVLYLRLVNGKWSGNYTNAALCNVNDNTALTYMGPAEEGATLIFSGNPLSSGTYYFGVRGTDTQANTCIDQGFTANVTIPKGTTSDVKVIVEVGSDRKKDAEAILVRIIDQWSISEIRPATAYINIANTTQFDTNRGVGVNNATSANATITLGNATLDRYANRFNATLALDNFPSWLRDVRGTGACSLTFNATKEAPLNNCSGSGNVILTFNIKGNETLTPTKIALSKFDITQVDGKEYSKKLLATYSGDRTLLNVIYDGLVVYIPRFAHRKEGNPKTYVNLATTASNASVRVCKFAGECYNGTISLDKNVRNLYERDSRIEDFLNGYSGALRLEFINVSDPSQLVCYTVFIRADGTVVRVPCLMGSGVESGADRER